MVRLAVRMALGLSPSFSRAKQWLLRMRCREDFTIRPLGVRDQAKTLRCALRAAASARRLQNGAAADPRFYRRPPLAPPTHAARRGVAAPQGEPGEKENNTGGGPPSAAPDWRVGKEAWLYGSL